MKKYQEILALTASILVIVLVLGAFTVLVMPKRHSFGSTWGHYLAEEPDSIDVLFVGSSLTYCNVIPALFWEKTGLTAYDVTGPALTVPGEYYFLREALKTQSPSVVFIEITAALYQRYTGHTDTMLGYIPWGENRLLAALNEAEPEKLGGLLFPMLTYHSRWSELKEDDWKVFLHGYEPDLLAGYTYLGEARVVGDYSVRTDALDREVIARNMEYLHKIAELCREEGIIPVFYESPAAAVMPPEEMDKVRAELAAIEGAVVVNFNDHRDEIGAALDYDYYDDLHYNTAGAEKFSRFLGEWFNGNLTVQPRPGQNTQLWQSRLDYILKLLEKPMTVK